VIAAGDVVAHKKPAPDVYRFALDTLGCDPGSCVAIEDSENGIKAARAAGLPVLAAPSYYLKGDDFSLATSVLTDLGEPDRPCRQIGGLSFDRNYVDIDGLNAWLSVIAHVLIPGGVGIGPDLATRGKFDSGILG
jgi:hypothetical protein